MAEQKILADYLNGMNKAQIKGLRFQQFGTFTLADADASTQAVGNFCQVNTVVYYRATAGQPLVAIIDNAALTTQLTALQTTLTNQIAQGNMLTPFNASSATTFPANSKNGQGYYVTSGGVVNGITFTANDVFFAEKDNATAWSDFGDILPIASIATAGMAGVVKIATTLAEYNADITNTNLAVSAPVINSLLTTINNTITSITNRVTALENRLNQKFRVELTDSLGVLTETTYTTLQAAIDYADTQSTATNKRIYVGQDTKITSTIKFKSTIQINFCGHDVYATSDITLFDDALMAPTNGGHIELVEIKDLVVAFTDTTGSTNAIIKTTGTGTNRRVRIHCENIFSTIPVFRSSAISTDGTATAIDILVENVVDFYSTAGSIVSNYNDRYGAISAHHSCRMIDITSASFKIDVVVGKFLRCNGFINNTPTTASSYAYLECPNIRIMMSYLVSGTAIQLWVHAKRSITTAGASLVKMTASTAAMWVHFKDSVIRSMGASSDFTGNLGLYHAASDSVMNTPATPTGVPVCTFHGSCELTSVATLFYQTAQASGIETWINGTLCSSIDINSVVRGGQLIVDSQFNPQYLYEPNLR